VLILLDEFKFIKKIKQNSYKQPSLIKGIGDDAAVFKETQENIVIAKDTFVENIHFSKQTMNFFHVGYRSLAANLSDLAAMGALPTYYLVSVVVPKNYKRERLMNVYDGMMALANDFHIDLIGGDTVSGETFVLTITVIGKVNEQEVRYRHTAREGDIVFVTGTLGDSRAGLYLLKNDLSVNNDDYFIKRHQMPYPQVVFSQLIRKIARVTLNDVSDGIAREALEIAEASDKTIILNDDKIPIHDDLSQFTKKQQNEWKYNGGEDFELIGTIHKNDWFKLKEAAKKANIKLTQIGHVTSRKQQSVYIKKNNELISLEVHGYTHLK